MNMQVIAVEVSCGRIIVDVGPRSWLLLRGDPTRLA